MAHKTLVDGTAYEISGGNVKVGGTGYKISAGKTMVKGTGYNISFTGAPTGWLLNKIINIPSSTIELEFISNETTFVRISKSGANLRYEGLHWNQVTVYNEVINSWTNNAYRTIKFVGEPSSTALTWLAANGKPIY